jgi:nitroreductase
LAKIAREGSTTTNKLEEGKIRQALNKPFRAPVIIAVACTPHLTDPKVHQIEEQAAVSAAIQNMLLAAHSLGLGAIWRTGWQTYHPEMKKLFGLQTKDEILGFIYLGYPEAIPSPRQRTAVENKTVWIDTDRPYV